MKNLNLIHHNLIFFILILCLCVCIAHLQPSIHPSVRPCSFLRFCLSSSSVQPHHQQMKIPPYHISRHHRPSYPVTRMYKRNENSYSTRIKKKARAEQINKKIERPSQCTQPKFTTFSLPGEDSIPNFHLHDGLQMK
ncbi:hypothetical protein EYC84_002114 [Monilinia fructicola]|uniref:Uncharacterized protein n=1 Tax=Monilinia fructicola TaxID=38448 RepID=A0A5M9JWF1_MONFR|nr:hypothetical protein EYC84_002114 [Monilinia fructicola]